LIRIDHRTGSAELQPYFKRWGVEAMISQLEFADFAFTGNGQSGRVVVGVERKTIRDLVNSMESKRFAGHQLPGLLDNYHDVFLVVEGVWRRGEDGSIEELRKGWQTLYQGGRRLVHYRGVDNFLTTMSLCCGVLVKRTLDAPETAAAIVNLYRWYEKRWEQHESHKAVYAPAEVSRRGKGVLDVRPSNADPPLVLKMLMQVDGMGQELAERAVAKMPIRWNEEKDWMRVEGIGRKKADLIISGLRELMRNLGHEPAP
jgi:ERCC4-type nuclease